MEVASVARQWNFIDTLSLTTNHYPADVRSYIYISEKIKIHCIPKAEEVTEFWQGCVFLHRLWQNWLIRD
jgi:hypothetical protein